MEKPVFVRDPTILDLKSLLFCFDNNQVFNKYIHVFLFFQQRELLGLETHVYVLHSLTQVSQWSKMTVLNQNVWGEKNMCVKIILEAVLVTILLSKDPDVINWTMT